MVKILLGFNCNCFTNRYDEPEEWVRICAELGIRHVMFSIDLIDPYWPWAVQKDLCDRTLKACRDNDVEIRCSFGGHHNHQHYLGHPDEQVRSHAEDWFKRCVDQTAYLGGKSFGTCFAIQTCRAHHGKRLRAKILAEAIEAYYRLGEYAAEAGLDALAYEITSVERESCATFQENDDVLERCSKMAVPMKICLDLGHRNLAGLPEEANHLEWIRRYGASCEVIDCHQTDLVASRHWPFTEHYNTKGIIKPPEVIKAIEDSGASAVMLAFEIQTPAFHPHEGGHLENLRMSVDYWRQWVKD